LQDLFNLTSKLCETTGISGDENNISELIKKEIGKFVDKKNIFTDSFNNLTARTGNLNSKRKILLDAHIDQIGLIVTSIEKGFLRVAPCGGVDRRVLPGLPVKIHAEKEILGIISSTPPHLQKSSEDKNKAKSIDELIIDTGLDEKTAENLISPGTYCSFNLPIKKLLNNRIFAPGLDNRASVATLIYTASLISKENFQDKEIIFLFSTREETGAFGAKVSAFNLEPSEAVVIDVSFAVQPDVRPQQAGKLSQGPMIGIGPAVSRNLSNKFINLAKNNNINYQLEVMSGRTGTNADSISESKNGTEVLTLSIPLRNMHTPVEIIDLQDLKNTAELLKLYLSC